MASRVVPGSAATTKRSSPNSWFTSDDLPTLGRPTTATWIASVSGSSSAGGSSATMRSSKSPELFPTAAEMGNGSPSPSS